MNSHPILFAVGINHRTAPLELRERIYVHDEEVPALLGRIRETASEAAVLSTCNRTEIYAVTNDYTRDLDYYKRLVIEYKKAGDTVEPEDFFGFVSCAACQQLFRVATSVDSKLVGDTQILGQLRDAYQAANSLGSTGKILNHLFQRGFKTGKRARTETALHKGAVSVSLAAVDLAGSELGNLHARKAVVIGAGETARLAADALVQRKIGQLTVLNRTSENAASLIAGLRKPNGTGTVAAGFDELIPELSNADIVISATGSPEPVLGTVELLHARRGTFIFDIAVPRDVSVEAAALPNIVYRNIDDLKAVVDSNHRKRMAEVPKAKRIIMNEMTDFLVWYYSLPLMPKMVPGSKPEGTVRNEIVHIKEFLMKNVSTLHKMAMTEGAETFQGHAAVVNELMAMRNTAGPAGQRY